MKKLTIIFITMFLLVSFVAADITVQDYTYTIARGDSDSQTRSVTNNINENVNIDFSATTISSLTDSFSGTAFTQNPLAINGIGSEDLEVTITVPTSTEPGVYTGDIEYNSDNGSLVSSGTSTLTITVTNEAAEIVAIPDQTIIVGTTYNYQVIAIDAETDTLTYSLTQAPLDMAISATGLINGWNPSMAGTNTIVVSVFDGFDTTTEEFIISVQNDVPKLTLDVDSILFGGDDEERGNTIVKTITVENTGVQNLNNLQVKIESVTGSTLSTKFNGVVSINKASLAVGETAIVTISLDIPQDQDSQKRTIGRVEVTADGTVSQTSDNSYLEIEAKSYLRIKDVEIDVEGDDENIDDGDVYDEIKEGDKVKITVTLENLYSDSDNIEIEDAYFEIEADENDWDIEDESDEMDIKEDDEEDFVLTFTIDDNIDDDETEVTIRAYGIDEDEDFEHYDELTFSFEIDRERDEVRIISFDFDKPSYSCNDAYAELEVKFKNTGTDDQDEVVFQVVSDDLDWHKRLYNIELDEGDSETEIFRIPLDNLEKSNEFFVDLEVFVDNDEETDSDVAVLTYICGTINTGNTNNGGLTVPDGAFRPDVPIGSDNNVVIVAPPIDGIGDSENIVYGKPIGAFDDFRNSNLYMILLIAVIIFVLSGIVLLGANLFKKN